MVLSASVLLQEAFLRVIIESFSKGFLMNNMKRFHLLICIKFRLGFNMRLILWLKKELLSFKKFEILYDHYLYNYFH